VTSSSTIAGAAAGAAAPASRQIPRSASHSTLADAKGTPTARQIAIAPRLIERKLMSYSR
jgi:hypothetical protein